MTKYATALLDFEDRLERKEVRLPKGYMLNELPYQYAKERYHAVMGLVAALAGNIWNVAVQQELESKIGSSAKGYVMYVLHHNRVESNDVIQLNRQYIAEQCYNKVMYWNIYSNKSRVFVAKVDTEDLFYIADKSMGINKYYKSQVEQFVKAAMDTDATVFLIDQENQLLSKLVFHKGHHSWDYKNEYWNELVAQIMMNTCNTSASPEAALLETQRYRELMTKFSNLEMSSKLNLIDYTTKFYYNNSVVVRDVDIETYKFMRDHELLEEKVDVEEIEAQLEYLKGKIKKAYLANLNTLVSKLAEEYMELDASLSREYALDNQLGYNTSIDADKSVNVEDEVLAKISYDEYVDDLAKKHNQ